ncbi:armadillo-type protein [Blastocladiella britannica]|nr:armadillo-type protein [Blastocladiella britannica]
MPPRRAPAPALTDSPTPASAAANSARKPARRRAAAPTLPKSTSKAASTKTTPGARSRRAAKPVSSDEVSSDGDNEDDDDADELVPAPTSVRRRGDTATMATTTTGGRSRKAPAPVASAPATPTRSTTAATPAAPLTGAAAVAHKIAAIFTEAQKSKAAHRKLYNLLRATHLDALRRKAELEFMRPFVQAVGLILSAKHGGAAVERALAFLPGFLAFSRDKDRAAALKNAPSTAAATGTDQDDQDLDDEKWASSGLASWLIHFCLRGIDVKDKAVRLRCARLVRTISETYPTMNDDLYRAIKEQLLARTRDREPAVRKEIVAGLALLQGGEEPNEPQSAAQSLATMAEKDPSPVVRRAAVAETALTNATIVPVLSRCRDEDPATRRTVYKTLAASIPSFDTLPADLLNTLLSNGLRDPDATVRAACIDMMRGWVGDDPVQLLRMLARINVTKSPVAEAAAFACLRPSASRPGLKVQITRDWWRTLSPESALLLRCHISVLLEVTSAAGTDPSHRAARIVAAAASLAAGGDGNNNNGGEDSQAANELDQVFYVDRMVYFLQLHANNWIANEDDAAEAGLQFIVHELLKLAMQADYADEHGRKQMFALARNLLGGTDLGPLTRPAVELVRMLSFSDRDFVRVVADVLGDFLEALASAPGDGIDEADQEQVVYTLAAGLSILRSALEVLPAPTPESVLPLEGAVNELILPALTKYGEVTQLIPDALACLGLLGHVSADRAVQTAGPFMMRYMALTAEARLADDELAAVSTVAAAALSDFVLLYGLQPLGLEHDAVADAFVALLTDPMPAVGITTVPLVVKLLLSGRLVDDELLFHLLSQYVTSRWSTSPETHQCLDYFAAVFPTTTANKRQVASQLTRLVASLHNESNLRSTVLLTAAQKAAVMLEDATIGADLQLDAMLSLLAADPNTASGDIPLKPAVQIAAKWAVTNGGGPVDADKVRAVQRLLAEIPAASVDVATVNAIKRLDKTLAAAFVAAAPTTATVVVPAAEAESLDLAADPVLSSADGHEMDASTPPVATTTATRPRRQKRRARSASPPPLPPPPPPPPPQATEPLVLTGRDQVAMRRLTPKQQRTALAIAADLDALLEDSDGDDDHDE